MTTLEIKYLYARSRGGYYNDDDDWVDAGDNDVWEDTYQGDGDGDYEALGHCCGAGTHAARDTKVNAQYGIDLYPGKCGNGVTTKATQRAHIETKNGMITACIRIAPWKDK